MKILIIAEHKNGVLAEATRELFGLPLGQAEIHAVVAGEGIAPLAEPLGQLGAAKVRLVDSPALAGGTGESLGQALGQVIPQLAPDVVLTAHTPQGRDLAPRLAEGLDAALATDCIQATFNDGQVTLRRPVYAGKATAEVEFTDDSLKVITIRPRTAKAPEPDTALSAEVTSVSVQLSEQKTVLKEIIAGGGERPDVTEAAIIVTGGRSLGSAENFSIIENFADTIGAAVGSSRAAVDAGYRPYRDQVGQTGKVVSPQVYIACGVSGAIQHLAGMRTSKHIVAINTDPDAPIFQLADHGIVGDLFEVVPLLAEAVKNRTGG
ncbi:MAG: electron transfer flavoprotein subunit alpha/FixB family protein [Verrucomicrobiota bacterium]|jgi:electron transfer flavoprotein alpha subunit|nr:electron transfer flavoprotein subunit alpha/FixB family protein [Verrucomicrobiota bacterium]MDP7049473.1 electron transfer flavoprotein subunit alpha/FixB family protein [Verrucomicrobiota bacterium]